MFFKNRQSHDARKGQELFERGMLAASRYECDEAIKLYTASIEANPNPAPYINCAKLFSENGGAKLGHGSGGIVLLRAV